MDKMGSTYTGTTGRCCFELRLVKVAGRIAYDLEARILDKKRGENHRQSDEMMTANPAVTRKFLKIFCPCLISA